MIFHPVSTLLLLSELILFFLIPCSITDLPLEFIPSFSWSPSEGELQHLVIHKVTGQIYIGGTNYLYHTNADLQIIAQQSSVTAGIVQTCSGGSDTCTPVPLEQDNKNRVLLVSYNRSSNFVIACGSAYYGTCVLHDPSRIDQVEARIFDENEDNLGTSLNSFGIRETVVAFFGSIRGGEQGIYVGSTYEENLFNRNILQHSVATKKLTFDTSDSQWKFNYGYAEARVNRYTFIDVLREYRASYKIDYIHGFGRQDYSYFLTVQKSKIHLRDYHTRIVRICTQDKAYYSYTEMPLICKSSDGNKVYNILRAAYIGQLGSKLAEELRLDSTSEVIYGVFSESVNSSTKIPSSKSGLCIFPLKTVGNKFKKGLQTCFYGRGTQGLNFMSEDAQCTNVIQREIQDDFCGTGDINPVESQETVKVKDYLLGGGHGYNFTSIAAKPQGEDTVVVLGTGEGNILKYVLDPMTIEGVKRTYPSKPYKRLILDTPGPVLPDMPFDLTQNQDNIYAMTPTKVYRIEMNTCDHYTRCSACVLTHDPIGCGWCGGSCLSQEECNTTRQGSLWNQNVCSPAIFEVVPTSGPLIGGTVISIIGDNLGILIGNGSHTVTVAGYPCEINQEESDLSMFVCTTMSVSKPSSGPVVVSVEVQDNDFRVTGNATSSNEYHFSFVEPMVQSFTPMIGPIAGGTEVTIRGTGLNAGNQQEVTVAGVPCNVTRAQESAITCITLESDDLTSGPILVSFDAFNLTTEGKFTFVANPYVSAFNPNKTIMSGGYDITISGLNLHLAQSLQMRFAFFVDDEGLTTYRKSQECTLTSSSTATCTSPDIRDIDATPTASQPITGNVTFLLGNMLMKMNFLEQDSVFQFFPDPVLVLSTEDEYTVGGELTLMGENLNTLPGIVTPTVLVDDKKCELTFLSNNLLKCKLPPVFSNTQMFLVKVQFKNLEYEVGWIMIIKPFPIILIIICLVVILGVIIASLILIVRKRSKSREYETAATTELPTVEYLPTGNGTENGATVRVTGNTYLRHPSNQDTADVIIGGATAAETRPLLECISKDIQMLIAEVLVQEDNVTLGDVIGRGHFGCVYEGRYFQDRQEMHIAAKSLLRGTSSDAGSFLKEGIMMKDFNHPNVLELIGVCITRENQPLVLLPFMENGDLLSYIRNSENELTGRQLLNFSRQLAEGMAYLSSLKFVHRDLAARNCMLNDQLIVKVADFGLSRDMYEKDYYSGKDKTVQLPIRWMALECLERNVYSTKTDVWSYGIVMWELLTRGMTPYATVDNWDLTSYLQRGRRLPQPDHCPDHIYQIMLNCWSLSPVDRPTFESLAEQLSSILNNKQEDAAQAWSDYDMNYVNVPYL